MKALMVVLGIVAAALLFSGCAPATPAGAPAAKKALLMGSTSTTSLYFLHFVAAAKIINSKVPEVSVTVVETGATVENLKRMRKGELHLGLTCEDQRYLALRGMEKWKDEPIPDVRLLWIYTVAPVPAIVREDSGVKRIEDLDGKDFNPGMRGSATESGTKAYFEVLGIKPKWHVGGLEDALAATKDRRIVGYSKATPSTGAPDSSILELMTFTPIRVIGLREEQVQKIRAQLPWLSFANIEAGVYKADWNKDPIPSFAVVCDVSTRTELISEDLAYKITKAVVEDNRPGGEGVMAAGFHPAKGFDFAVKTVGLADSPIHAGALKYYKELGLKIKDGHIPPEAKK